MTPDQRKQYFEKLKISLALPGDINRVLGSQVRYHRTHFEVDGQKVKLTQTQLGRLLGGLHQTAVTRIEQGTQKPTPEELYILNKLFHTDLLSEAVTQF